LSAALEHEQAGFNTGLAQCRKDAHEMPLGASDIEAR
jgi:hypothetical protein